MDKTPDSDHVIGWGKPELSATVTRADGTQEEIKLEDLNIVTPPAQEQDNS